MKNVGKLQITTPSDREIAMTRVFDAPRKLVFEAYTKPELLKQWLGAFGDWSLAVCEIDLRVGGRYRWEWHHRDGQKMGASGVYREIVPAERLVNTEQFDDPWYEGESLITSTFVEQGGKTTFTTTMLYTSKETRDAVLKSPMDTGVAKSYDKLAEVVASMLAQEAK
jgi:uncharacterized protein YndB with AHSA1/START domain